MCGGNLKKFRTTKKKFRILSDKFKEEIEIINKKQAEIQELKNATGILKNALEPLIQFGCVPTQILFSTVAPIIPTCCGRDLVGDN